jgi:hypothetical protein
MYVRNNLVGRRKVLLSDKPDKMSNPITIDMDLYAEVDFSTEWLLKNLINRILSITKYDYSGVSVAFTKGGQDDE